MSTATIPRMSRGLATVGRSLATVPPRRAAITDPAPWRDDYVRLAPAGPNTRIESMTSFGYPADAQRHHEGRPDTLGLIGPIRVLEDDGVKHLASICETLMGRAPEHPHIVSKRLRHADGYSDFLHAMVRSTAFLQVMSRLAGVPLMLHPHPDAAVQINYYIARDDDAEAPQLARWHTDGMDYVYTLLLTDESLYTGGDFRYFRGTKAEFEDTSDRTLNTRIETASFRALGEGIFSRGSAIYHGVTPVTSGHRITLVVSLFCPWFHRSDGNRFWHSAPDDGLLPTLRSWYRFKRPWLTPGDFIEDAGYAVPTWQDIEDAT